MSSRTRRDSSVSSLGERSVPSPLPLARSPRADAPAFTPDDARVLRDIELPRKIVPGPPPPRAFERAGPREQIYFDPKRVTVGIVTAGGICPGINDVIRGIVLELRHAYGVDKILGFRFGMRGSALALHTLAAGRAPGINILGHRRRSNKADRAH